MKVALVFDDAFNRPDGVQEYMRALAVYLARQGHVVDVLCSGDGGQPSAGVSAVHSLTRNVGVEYNGNRVRTPLPASRRRIRALLDAERYDVIHVMSPHSPVFAARVVAQARKLEARLRGGGAPWSVRIVGTFTILPDGGSSARGIRFLGRLLRRNLAHFDAFCGLSGPASDLVNDAYGLPSTPIPAPVDVAALRTQAVARPWQNSAPADRVVIAFMGRMVERKGVLELVAALAALPAEVRRQVLVRLGGRGPLLEQVRAAVSAAGLEETVSLEGFIADEDKGGFLAAADIAVFPATGGESFGIVLIEAMAAGAQAVLAGNNPGYTWTIDDPDAVIDARDTRAFAATLEYLITDAQARAELHRRQESRLAAFDLPVVGEQIEELYGWR